MQKHMRKKRHQRQKCQKHPIRKPVSTAKLHFHTQWEWMIAAIVLIIGCFVLIAFAMNQQLGASETIPISPTFSLATSISAPTLVGSGNIQRVQQATGIFSLSEGGPIPVPANVLHPTNIARVVVKNVLTSIYAGAMTRTPAIGAIVILQENITTGQQSLNVYQTAQPVGEVTILAVHGGILTLSTPTVHGTFNLQTDQFHFA